MYQLARFSFGNARSLAPIMSGTRKLPSTVGIVGIRKKNTMMIAVHREELVVRLVGDEVAGRRGEFQADEHGEDAADDEEERHRREVEQRDALVVAGQEPRSDAVARVEVVARRERRRAGGLDHGWPPPGSGCNDFTYSISASRSSSVTRPWNAGMIGWNPATTSSAGRRIELRM